MIANMENNQWPNSNCNNVENCMTYFHLKLLGHFPFFHIMKFPPSLWCPISPAVFALPQGDSGVKFPPCSLVENPVTTFDYCEIVFDQTQIQEPLGVDSSLTVEQKQKFTIRTVSPEYCYATETTKARVF